MHCFAQRGVDANVEADDEGALTVDGTKLKPGYNPLFVQSSDTITPYIIMCATMWHENEREMVQILQSIIRSVRCFSPSSGQ